MKNDDEIGEFLGRGCFRETFVYKPDPSLVIKFEFAQGKTVQINRKEFELYNKLTDKQKEVLAPIVHYDEENRIIYQVRGIPFTRRGSLNYNFPDVSWIGPDNNYDNWVLIEDQPKLCDFGSKSSFRKFNIS